MSIRVSFEAPPVAGNKLLNDNIQTIEGVSRTETYISLIQQIKRQIQV